MKSPKRSTAHWRELCAELRPEDGSQDPRRDRKHETHGAERATLRLCGQVARTLRLALASCGDPVLQSLAVEAVTPGPDPGRLVVMVTPALPGDVVDPARVAASLSQATGFLRSEVAASICRKRVPQLSFEFNPGEVGL